MRYYNLSIYPPQSSTPQDHTISPRSVLATNKAAPPPRPVLQFCSHIPRSKGTLSYLPMGQPTDSFDPGALEVNFTVTESNAGRVSGPTGGASVTVKGVDITTINQASNLVGHTLILKVGMGKGLPLSNPNQAGTILHGTIKSSLGNWEGTEMNISFFVAPYQAVNPDPKSDDFAHIIHCQRGQNVKEAIKHSLITSAYNAQVTFKSEHNPLAPQDFIGYYKNVKEHHVSCSDLWEQVTGNPLTISLSGQTVSASDQTDKRPIKKITLEEMIGQPTWNGDDEISIMCPMRGDLHIKDSISLPNEINTSGFAKFTKNFSKDISLFSGIFDITSLSHLGDSRSKDGRQWATTITCKPNNSTGIFS